MITFLSGGTGTPKLLMGMRSLLPDREMAVVVNTAEDTWISGNYLSPDLDTVMYLFAGLADTGTWWGIAGDTFTTHDALLAWGGEEPLKIGDRDRAVHILRGELLRKGMRLTGAQEVIARRLGVEAALLPMADTPVATLLDTDLGLLHFQDFWVKHQGKPRVKEIVRRFPEPPKATPEVLRAIVDKAGSLGLALCAEPDTAALDDMLPALPAAPAKNPLRNGDRDPFGCSMNTNPEQFLQRLPLQFLQFLHPDTRRV